MIAAFVYNFLVEMSKRSSVQLVEREEPSFIKKFKAKVGYVEPCTVDDKFKPSDDSSKTTEDPVKEDETPAIVILPSNREITQNDIDAVKKQILNPTETASRDAPSHEDVGKIKFQAPVLKSDGTSKEVVKPSKKCTNNVNKAKDESTCAVQVSNQSLLSFGDDEESE